MDDWARLLRVTVATPPDAAADPPAVLGTYTVTDDAVRFTPRYPFDPGRRYHVVFDPTRLPTVSDVSTPMAGWRGRSIEATVQEPAVDLSPTTQVVRIFPTGSEIPENQLRFYIEFSAPMGRAGGLEHVQLTDVEGGVVEDAFLPLDVAMWNGDRTRYTLLFDPGRVKRGILPNEEMGRPLVEGRHYRLDVESAWLDDRGLPLVGAYRQTFRVAPALERAIDPTEWSLAVPAAGTREALVVSFDRALDYPLLHRALVVTTASRRAVAGDIDVGDGERTWRFTPDDPWDHEEHALTALPILEDPSGNRVGRAFEVGTSSADPAAQTPSTVLFLPSRPH